MIECTEQYIYKKCKKKKRKKLLFFLISILLISIFVYYRAVVSFNVSKIVKDMAYSVSVNCINTTIINKIDINYKDLTIIERNNNNEITLISFNFDKINLLTRNIVYNVNIDLQKRLDSGFEIPIMAFTGISFFSGYGLKVNFNSLNISSVEVDYENEFNSSGINQTLHCIYANIKSLIKVELPLSNNTFEIDNKVLISQSLIVGKVPEVYFNS